LQLAEPEGHVRAFVDEGPALAGLLRAALDARQSGSQDVPRTVSAPYLRKLLAALEHHPQTRPPSRPAAPDPAGVTPALEPLTEREREVLVLIAAGKSNRQIAAELVVTEGTVKTHLTHVYRKLDAHSRTQALVRGRELDLI
jgi:LuxR family maltose regulon positive regulatory protein